MRAGTYNARFGFSVAALLALLLAIVVGDYGLVQMESNHAAIGFVALGCVLIAFAFICSWFAWASSKLDTDTSPADHDPAI